MRILWIFDVDCESEMRHGASLRAFNLARELVANGHEVHLVTNHKPADDPIRKERFLRQLVDRRFITAYFEATYNPSTVAKRLARFAVHPALGSRVLRRFQEPTRVLMNGLIARYEIDLCVVADRHRLFLVPALSRTIPTVIDWIDSFVLFWLRQLAVHVRAGRVTSIPYVLGRLVDALIEETYYGRRAHVNVTASPVDRHCLDLVNGTPSRNNVLPNGVAIQKTVPAVAPLPNRLLFSGNMSFPPNYEGALWFIDHVMPLLLEKNRDIVLVVAGANPTAELLSRGGPNVEVKGFVADLEREIAKSALSVAPLISGGGFKNKITEAIAADRFVVATSRAAEFLDPSLRAQLLVGDTPRAMADHILSYLDNPSAYETALVNLRQRIAVDFTWARRAEQLLTIFRSIVGPRVVDDRRGEPGPCHGIRVRALQADDRP